jgi:hypothetical protein
MEIFQIGGQTADEEITMTMTIEGDNDNTYVTSDSTAPGDSDSNFSLDNSSSGAGRLQEENIRLLEENMHLRREKELVLENERLLLENAMLRKEKELAEQNEKLLKENARLRQNCEEIRKGAQSEPKAAAIWALPFPMLANPEQLYRVPQATYPSMGLPCGVFETPQPVSGYPPGMWHNVRGDSADQSSPKQIAPMPKQKGRSKAPKEDSFCVPESSKLPHERTTIMLRNLPNNYNLAMLLDLIDGLGFASLYDFIYLPIDFVTEASLAYAFVNLTSHEAANKFKTALDGFSQWIVPTKKRCIVGWSGPCQGLEEHIERYRNSPVMHESVPTKFKPAVFIDGVRSPFPPPTKKVRPPRIRAGRNAH